MKVLVTGASGFLGGYLVEQLVKHKHTVRAAVRPTSSRKVLENLPVEIVVGDMNNSRSLAKMIEGIDAVIHSAVATGGTLEYMEKVNIEGTKIMLDLARKAEVKRFVFLSSLVVYDINSIPKNSLIDESFELEKFPKKVGPYAYTKTESEKLVQEYIEKHQLPIAIVRPGLIYGARRDLFFPHFGFRALGGKIMVKIGWEKKILPLTYVENTCEIIVKLLTHDDVIGKVYNIVDPQTITYNQYLDYYKKAMGVKPLVIPMPFSALLCAAFVFEQLNKLPRFRGKFGLTRYRLYPKFKKVRFDGSLVLKTLDWYPNISLEEGLKRAFSR